MPSIDVKKTLVFPRSLRLSRLLSVSGEGAPWIGFQLTWGVVWPSCCPMSEGIYGSSLWSQTRGAVEVSSVPGRVVLGFSEYTVVQDIVGDRGRCEIYSRCIHCVEDTI